jgi:hypothetical protein
VIEIEHLENLENIISGVRKTPGVHDVWKVQRDEGNRASAKTKYLGATAKKRGGFAVDGCNRDSSPTDLAGLIISE